MREALTLALQEVEAAVVVVSHDRHLLRTTCDELWLVAGGTATPFDGDLDDYATCSPGSAMPCALPGRERRQRSNNGWRRAKPAIWRARH